MINNAKEGSPSKGNLMVGLAITYVTYTLLPRWMDILRLGGNQAQFNEKKC